MTPARVRTPASQPEQTSEWPRSHAAVVRTVVAGSIALVLTLAYAAPFGSVNQATYLLDPLQRAMPELFARDWFVSETPSYMPAFGWLA